MIDQSLVIAQLQTLGVFAQIGGAAEASRVMGPSPSLALGVGPGAFVVPLHDAPEIPKTAQPLQNVVMSFGVLIFVRAAGDAGGLKAIETLKPVQDAVLDGLLGWQISPGYSPVWWSAGRLLDFQPGILWWLDEFAVRCGIAPTAALMTKI